METQYYMINGAGQQMGPFGKEALLTLGLTPDTLVWTQGMADWTPARNVAELNELFNQESAFGGYAIPETKPNPGFFTTPENAPFTPVPHTNWMPWAIIATIVGVLVSCIGAIFGIIGIVQANKANSMYSLGRKAEGDSANSTAKIMTIIAFVLSACGIGFLTYILQSGKNITAMLNVM